MINFRAGGKVTAVDERKSRNGRTYFRIKVDCGYHGGWRGDKLASRRVSFNMSQKPCEVGQWLMVQGNPAAKSYREVAWLEVYDARVTIVNESDCAPSPPPREGQAAPPPPNKTVSDLPPIPF